MEEVSIPTFPKLADGGEINSDDGPGVGVAVGVAVGAGVGVAVGIGGTVGA
jgi:hypothetical protein